MVHSEIRNITPDELHSFEQKDWIEDIDNIQKIQEIVYLETCNGLVELSMSTFRYNPWICNIWKFTPDLLEKQFGKLKRFRKNLRYNGSANSGKCFNI